ncbi:hypothetical protein QKU48_gp0981 [Fadolivirus algeromassiliense]|jgi:hypothetical protein|uniref:Uncharacterized protein n=1 Tax=Fadolivirus FV1/VV64 TaxID=3070911 RepID=A0A7D3QWE1_9VIRU|nr:hypothetical protein QKU48_gp0981 [Fadolivirus algeromassiliense]QKF94439.1 hypothetical protein Fadolivirus_1_981 [Fadolivirus FV1/VV64]
MTSLISVNKYRLYCNTNSQWEYTFSQTLPSTCPINGTHSINNNSIQIVDTIECVNVTSTDSPYSITQNSVFCNTADGHIIINLPKASRTTNSQYLIKKTSSSNTLSIIPYENELIDGLATKNITLLNDTVMILSNGFDWTTISFYNLDKIDDYNSILVAGKRKGDILFDNGKELVGLPVGNDNYILLADSTQQTGTKWSSLNHGFLVNGGTYTHSQIDTHIASSSSIHGINSTIVDTNNAQSITNKTITSNTNIIRATHLGTNNISINTSTTPQMGHILKTVDNQNAIWDTTIATVPGDTTSVVYNDGLINATHELHVDGDGYVIINDHATMPEIPSYGTKLMTIHNAGRCMSAQLGPSSIYYSCQPFLATNKIGWWTPQGNGTTLTNINIGNVISGSAQTRNIATTNLFTSMRRIGYNSSNPSGSSAGTCHGLLQFWRGNGPRLGGFFYLARFGITSNKSDQRCFFGLANTAAALTNANPSTNVNLIGFAADDTDTSLYFITNDGVGTATKIALTGTFPSQTVSTDMYEIRIFCGPNSTTINYSIENLSQNSFYEGSVDTDIPSNTTLLCPQLWINNGNTSRVVGIDVVCQYIETDN